LEGLVLVLKLSVTVNLGSEGMVTELPKGLVHAIMPHIVSIEKPKDIGGDERGRNVDVNDGRSVNLAVVCGPIKRQSPFYKRVRGVKVGTDVMRRRFTAVLVSDTEWDEGGASIVLEAGRDWG
jgi:hypothetical protein